MIVHCEGCESSFRIEDHLIKPTGSKLRCSKCRHEFKVYPPAPVDEAEEPLILNDALPAAAGLLSGGSLEMYFAPGAEECYYQYFVRPGTDNSSTAEWSPPYRHYRPMDPYWKNNVEVIDNEAAGPDVQFTLTRTELNHGEVAVATLRNNSGRKLNFALLDLAQDGAIAADGPHHLRRLPFDGLCEAFQRDGGGRTGIVAQVLAHDFQHGRLGGAGGQGVEA